MLSAPPSLTQSTPNGTDWLGSPGFCLPNRQKITDFHENTTFLPTANLYSQRAIVDACRILVPPYTGLAVGLLGGITLIWSYESYGVWIMFALAPLVSLAAAALAVAVAVALKWAVMGKFRPVIKPLWSPYVWFNEMINGAYESIMAPILTMFLGTPFAAPLLRLLGCKVGRHCYIGTTLFSEFDLVEIGDYVALNAGGVIQTHLFEDRIMKS